MFRFKQEYTKKKCSHQHKWICLVLVLFMSNSLSAQASVFSDQEFKAADEQTFKSSLQRGVKIGMHMMPLSIVNRRARLRLGTAISFQRISCVVDLEYGKKWMPALIIKDNLINEFYGIRPEIRYHLRNPEQQSKNFSNTYFGLEIPINISERELGAAVYESAGTRYKVDGATQKRTWTSGIIKFGYVDQIGKRVYMDYYIGVGSANRQIEYKNEVNKVVTDELPTEEWFSSSDSLQEGKQQVIEFALGFRIGYTLH